MKYKVTGILRFSCAERVLSQKRSILVTQFCPSRISTTFEKKSPSGNPSIWCVYLEKLKTIYHEKFTCYINQN
jgi:hypothetical protein